MGSARKAKAREMHPTVKPLALVRDAILDCTAKGDAVLDLFSGSGTTIIAAEHVGRRGFATELDPRYVDVGVSAGRSSRVARRDWPRPARPSARFAPSVTSARLRKLSPCLSPVCACAPAWPPEEHDP